MPHIGTVAAFLKGNWFVVIRVFAKLSNDRSTALADFGKEADRAVETDIKNIVILLERFELAVMFDIGTEAPDPGSYLFASLRMIPNVPRQREESQGGFEFDCVGNQIARQGYSAWLALVFLASLSQLQIITEWTFPECNRQTRFRVGANITRPGISLAVTV